MLNFKNITILYICIFMLLVAASMVFYFPIWIYTALIASYLIIIAIGSFSMRLNFFMPALTENNNVSRKVVALTFDDGPNAMYTPEVLELLERYNATATFFCIGKQVEAYPELAKQIVNNGHEIGNHSHSHKPNISFNGTKCWIKEIENTDVQIEKVLGRKPRLFRPPYGVTSPHLAKAIGVSNHKVVGWTVRPFDTTMKNKKGITQFITKRIRPGAIILLHDTHHRIPYILEHTLIYLNDNGYKTLSVTDLLNEN